MYWYLTQKRREVASLPDMGEEQIRKNPCLFSDTLKLNREKKVKSCHLLLYVRT